MTNEKITFNSKLGVYVGKLSNLDNSEFHITEAAWQNMNDLLLQNGDDNSEILDPQFWAEAEYIGELEGCSWAHESMQQENSVQTAQDAELLAEIGPANTAAQFGPTISPEDRRYYAIAGELFNRGYRATGRGTWEK